jgi:hypothetical protein
MSVFLPFRVVCRALPAHRTFDMTQQSSDSAESDRGSMSVPDDALPEDLQPSEDNPLAEPAGDDVPDDALVKGAGHDDSGAGSEDASAGGGDDSDTSSDGASSGAQRTD